MQLDLNLLTALDALLEEESVSGAAQRLHLSEPAMSRTLGRIRKVTGDPILIRTGRTMTPTNRAISMREEVRYLVLRSGSVLAPETDLDFAVLERTFTLRCHDALTSVLAPVLVSEAARVAPGVSLRFLGEAPVDTADLGRGAVDLEIGSNATGRDIAREHVADDQLMGLARSGNPTIGAAVDVEKFAAARHVVVSRRGRFRDTLDDTLDTLGHTRVVVASVSSAAAAIEIVRTTDIVVTVASTVSNGVAAETDLRSFALPIQVPRVPVIVGWHRRLDSDLAHRWLRTTVKDAIRSTVGHAR
ncbi:LysR family transcriptional regulator [Rhodococcoides yunnanense]|uniref:LysR family transcriptional regulator n=1 Tax=Rhodococcoides yunnanense TaxID=278209 RepID=A0ABU4BIC6_9NOCA|nr:LysR family transcriptional regulator [Rhodococcus yunnanensis]MDV6263976.1 LysR family transcriptional regulator [Rhodococcus yunnanensis]